ncbi:hypothetical protein [Microcoleus sp. S36b_A4]|uniref:hypothetical protein n=1 Tax=Microcoleus sp. S36b_A4 TaxID=3055420 RepID=UPI002FD4B1E6
MTLKAFKIVKLTNSANVISTIIYAKPAFYGLRIVTPILPSLTKYSICGKEGAIGGKLEGNF